MNYQKRFEKCIEFLTPWLDLLEVEALKNYPNHISDNISSKIEVFKKLAHNDLWAFQNNFSLQNIKDQNLINFMNQIKELTEFNKLDIEELKLPNEIFKKVNPKKEHEIYSILSLVNKIGKVDTILDIGGGVGHLSSALVYGKERTSYCVDFDETLQKSGKARLKKWDKQGLEKIYFIHSKVDKNFSLNEFNQLSNRLVIGLHSCGCLGSDLIKIYSQNQFENLILASCCYHKLEGAYNLSPVAKEKGLIFSENTLHLASRCYRYESFMDFQNKLMLRRFRYALHILEYNHGHKQFRAIGNTSLQDYKMSFYEYTKKYSIIDSLDESKINSFYKSSEIQNSVRELILVDIFRAFLGRVVETYIVLDRLLFLQEKSYNVEIFEAFDRKISPRNLVILSR